MRAATVTLVAVAAVSAFYVRGIEPGITFATNGVDLKIDSKAWYNGSKVAGATWYLKNLVPGSDKFFDFDDIKPGDYGCNVISMHVKNTDAWMCLDFKNLQESENDVNEPESHEDHTLGADLAGGVEFFGWTDDGDGKYEPPSEKPLFGTSTQAASYVLNDKTYVIGDSKGGGMCKQNTTRYVGTCWCAGDLVVLASGKIQCDGTKLGNAAQTDSFSVDVEIRAEPVKDKPKFVCGSVPPKDEDDGDDNEDENEDDDENSEHGSGPVEIEIKNEGSVNSTTHSSTNTGGNSGNSSSNSNSSNTVNQTVIIVH